jgi:hypothetical protein
VWISSSNNLNKNHQLTETLTLVPPPSPALHTQQRSEPLIPVAPLGLSNRAGTLLLGALR